MATAAMAGQSAEDQRNFLLGKDESWSAAGSSQETRTEDHMLLFFLLLFVVRLGSLGLLGSAQLMKLA